MTVVAICVPSTDMVHADFAMSLAALAHQSNAILEIDQQSFEPIPICLVNVRDSLLIGSRNRAVDEARALGATHMLFIDSDLILHRQTLRRLLAFDRDIVGGTYVKRRPPHPLLGKGVDGRDLADIVAGEAVKPGELLEVGALPGGCLLIKMSVFDAFNGDLPFQTPVTRVEGQPPQIEGEDYFFCRRARELGFKVWLDWVTSFHIQHLGQQAFGIPAKRVETAEDAHAAVH